MVVHIAVHILIMAYDYESMRVPCHICSDSALSFYYYIHVLLIVSARITMSVCTHLTDYICTNVVPIYTYH